MLRLRRQTEAPNVTDEQVHEKPATPMFVCRTCRAEGPFYVARQVTNWNQLDKRIYRRPDGEFTYKTLNVYLPGESGPPLAYWCFTCHTSMETLGDLIEGVG